MCPNRDPDERIPAPMVSLWRVLLEQGRSWSPEATQEFVKAMRALHELLTSPYA